MLLILLRFSDLGLAKNLAAKFFTRPIQIKNTDGNIRKNDVYIVSENFKKKIKNAKLQTES